jgi:hypothetical protein
MFIGYFVFRACYSLTWKTSPKKEKEPWPATYIVLALDSHAHFNWPLVRQPTVKSTNLACYCIYTPAFTSPILVGLAQPKNLVPDHKA